MSDEVFDARAKLQRDFQASRHRGQERRLQIATMDHPIRRAVTLFGVAERQPDNLASVCRAHHPQRQGCDRDRPQAVAQPEVDQGARRVRRELNSGAGFLKPLGLLQDADSETVARQRQRRGQSADTGSGDNDDRRGRQLLTPADNSGWGIVQRAFRRPRGVRLQRRVVPIERRAIRANVLRVRSHVAEYVRMIEWRHGADAHELPGTDVNDGDAKIVMKMGND